MNARPALQTRYSLREALTQGKPYFGRYASALQSPPVRYAILSSIVKTVLGGKKTVSILEIGSWGGASLVTMHAALRETCVADIKITSVDSWRPYLGSEDTALHYKLMTHAASTGSIRKLFDHNIRVCGVRELKVMDVPSREALPKLEDQSFDFIYVDGSHRKEDVLYDLKEATRLVCQEGLICGDDLELCKQEVDDHHHRLALARGVDFIRDPKTGIKYHPGVTEAVSLLFGEVWQNHGLWCVRRSSGGWVPPDFNFSSDELSLPSHLEHAVEVPYGIYKDYAIYEWADLFVAYPVTTRFQFQNRLAQPALDDLILLIEAVGEANRASAVYLKESAGGFNIVEHDGRFWVVEQSIGPVDFRNEVQISNLLAEQKLFVAETLGEARCLINIRKVEEQ